MTSCTRQRWSPLAMALARVLIFAGCGSGDDGGGAGETSTTAGEDAGELTDSFRGVTADAITIGIVIVDYECIKDFVDFHRGDQQMIAQHFVDDLNETGGVLGRRIEPVYKSYCPIPGREPSPLGLCTALTEDEAVFAVLGVFVDFTGDGQLCVSRDHDTIMISHLLEEPWLDEADPALLLTPDSTRERVTRTLLELLEQETTLDGRTVAVLADQDAAGRVDDVILPRLRDIDVELGSTAVLTITGTDTSAAHSQLDAFIARWDSEDVDTIFMAGLNVSHRQFVERIKDAMPEVTLITDSPETLLQAQDAVAAGIVPNPYEGMLTTAGRTPAERWEDKSELFQHCVDVYEERSGETLLGPNEVKPDPDGRKPEIHLTVTDFCGELTMFRIIAERVGPDLTNERWRQTVDSFGAIELVTTEYASLCKGKYAAADAGRLVAFDSGIGEEGDYAPLTELVDASGPQCTS